MVTALPWSPTHQIPFAETPHGRLAPSSGRRVSRSSSRASVAHLVNARSHPQARLHAPFTQSLHAPGVRALPVGASCVTLVRSQVRIIGTPPSMHTSTKFALRFATINARTANRPANNRALPDRSPPIQVLTIRSQNLVRPIIKLQLEWWADLSNNRAHCKPTREVEVSRPRYGCLVDDCNLVRSQYRIG